MIQEGASIGKSFRMIQHDIKDFNIGIVIDILEEWPPQRCRRISLKRIHPKWNSLEIIKSNFWRLIIEQHGGNRQYDGFVKTV